MLIQVRASLKTTKKVLVHRRGNIKKWKKKSDQFVCTITEAEVPRRNACRIQYITRLYYMYIYTVTQYFHLAPVIIFMATIYIYILYAYIIYYLLTLSNIKHIDIKEHK